MTEQVQPRRILVPTDFSPGAEGALDWAKALGAAFSAEVVLLHVLDLSIAALAGLPSTLPLVPAARAARGEGGIGDNRSVRFGHDRQHPIVAEVPAPAPDNGRLGDIVA